MIKKVGDKYVVYGKSGGKRLGTHNSRKKAEKQLAAIEISKNIRGEVRKLVRSVVSEATTVSSIINFCLSNSFSNTALLTS